MKEADEFASKTALQRMVYAGFAACSLVVLGLIAAAPLLSHFKQETASSIVYQMFSASCHQQPERSFNLLGHKLAVCARCTGIYVGVSISSLAYMLLKKGQCSKTSIKWPLLAALPLAADWLGQHLGIWTGWNTLRFATGLLLGIAIPAYIIPKTTNLARSIITTLEGKT